MKGNGELLLLLIKGHFNTLKQLGDDLKVTQTREGKFSQLLPNRPRKSAMAVATHEEHWAWFGNCLMMTNETVC